MPGFPILMVCCALGAGEAQGPRPMPGLGTARIESLTGAKGAPAPKRASADTVVFVCEHGSVKSLVAREWFDRRARERGLGLRAVARGMTPDPSVPPEIGAALRRDGFDVSGFEPRALAPGDLARAARVVAIGVDTSAITAPADVPVESWEGIPPATQQYEAARDALRARVEGLLTALATAEAQR